MLKGQFSAIRCKMIVATFYNGVVDKDTHPYKLEWDGETETKTMLEGDGDFRSEECTKILQESDIVITNPPFSMFREFVKWLEDAGKKYLIIGNQNAITYKEIFSLIKENKMWLGYNTNKSCDFIIFLLFLSKYAIISDKAVRCWNCPWQYDCSSPNALPPGRAFLSGKE